MDDDLVDQVERRIAATVGGECAPSALREVVLRNVQRELRSSRWDRWLGRAAAALVALGVGLNGAVGWWGGGGTKLAASFTAGDETKLAASSTASLVATAAAVAEATDAETGRRVARQMAALGGWELTGEQAAAIDAAAGGRSQGSGVRGQGEGFRVQRSDGKG